VCSRLLLQRFAQFLEQLRVLNGDDGLGGEVFYQLDLLVCERLNLLAVNYNRSDQLAVLKHRHSDSGSRASELGSIPGDWFCCVVRAVSHFSCL